MRYFVLLIVASLCVGCSGPEGKVNKAKSFTSTWKLTNLSVKNQKSTCKLELSVLPGEYFGKKKATLKRRHKAQPRWRVRESSFHFNGDVLIEYDIKSYWKDDPSNTKGGEQFHYTPDELFSSMETFWRLPSGVAWVEEPGGKVLGVETKKMTTATNVGMGYNIAQHYWVDESRGVVLKAHFGTLDPGSGEIIAGTEFECLDLSMVGSSPPTSPSVAETTEVKKFSFLVPIYKME